MADTTLLLSGGCRCGAVRYRVAAPASRVVHCHCSICRRLHGAMFGSFAHVPRAAFRVTQGEGNLRTYKSSPAIERKFCARCGCHLFVIDDVDFRDVVILAAASLDNAAHPGHPVDAECHIYVASKAPWFDIADGLPQYDEYD